MTNETNEASKLSDLELVDKLERKIRISSEMLQSERKIRTSLEILQFKALGLEICERFRNNIPKKEIQ